MLAPPRGALFSYSICFFSTQLHDTWFLQYRISHPFLFPFLSQSLIQVRLSSFFSSSSSSSRWQQQQQQVAAVAATRQPPYLTPFLGGPLPCLTLFCSPLALSYAFAVHCLVLRSSTVHRRKNCRDSNRGPPTENRGCVNHVLVLTIYFALKKEREIEPDSNPQPLSWQTNALTNSATTAGSPQFSLPRQQSQIGSLFS